jgi:hypothetical protein
MAQVGRASVAPSTRITQEGVVSLRQRERTLFCSCAAMRWVCGVGAFRRSAMCSRFCHSK